jgi:4-amino-4-deoxy-L-arabinose transferase-like glycosyltransferase
MIPVGIQEYLMTAGAVGSLIAIFISLWFSRKSIAAALREAGLKKKHLVLAVLIALLFFGIEAILVKPTQLIFFDDTIYQSMAQQLLISGKAAWCQFGTPKHCFIGEVYQEPIGTPLTLAIGFAIGGINLKSAYNTLLVLGILSIFLAFFVALLIFEDPRPALFTELFLALTPVLIVWSRPTNSDVPFLLYSIVAVLAMLLFMKKKNKWTFSLMLFSLALLLYSKIDAIIYLALLPVLYLIFNGKGFGDSIRETWTLLRHGIDNTKVLFIVLIFVLLIFPQFDWAYYQFSCSSSSTSCGFGYQGTTIVSTCGTGQVPMVAQHAIDWANLKYNICGNVNFWFNQFSSQQIMEPFLFTVFAIVGALLLLVSKQRKLLLGIGVWFIVFFFFYTAFYAGSVTYGVDWRFMLSLVTQASLLAGFGAAALLDPMASLGLAARKKHKKIGGPNNRRNKKIMHAAKRVAKVAILIAIIAVISYSFYKQVVQISIAPSQILQAPDARFYESFVYNDSHLIPANCLVFTYDPTLFNINNRSATQMSDLYDTDAFANRTKLFSCSVLDYGYWCFTPNNICSQAKSDFNLTVLASSGVGPLDKNFTLYYINEKAAANPAN